LSEVLSLLVKYDSCGQLSSDYRRALAGDKHGLSSDRTIHERVRINSGSYRMPFALLLWDAAVGVRRGHMKECNKDNVYNEILDTFHYFGVSSKAPG
jgi:hypothetical protein